MDSKEARVMAEIERLKAIEVKYVELQAELSTAKAFIHLKSNECEGVRAELERYKAQLHEVREIYIGMDGWIPKYASEAYALRIIKQMYEEALDKSIEEKVDE